MAEIPENASLDDWLPRPTVRVAHHRDCTALPDSLWREASALRLDDCAALGRLVRWKIPDLTAQLTFSQMLREPPFILLHESRHLVLSGLVGRIWTLRRDYPQLSGPDAYRAWNAGGTARVLFGIRVDGEEHGSRLSVEVRVQALGLQGRLGVTALGPLIRSCEHLLGAEALKAAAQRAEASDGLVGQRSVLGGPISE
jgi:hypothetical protein